MSMFPAIRRTAALVLLAIACIAPAQAGDSAKAAGYYEDGLVRFEQGDMPGAIIQLKNALQQDENMLSAHVLLGRASLEQLELPAAEAAFDKALELGVSPVEIAVPRGRLYLLLGRSKELLSTITPAGQTGDALLSVLILRAQALVREGSLDDADAAFRLALDTDPASPLPYQEYVPFLIQVGKFEQADAAIETLKRIAPDAAQTWNVSASALHARGRLKDALTQYGKALDLDPEFVDARIARASIEVDLGQYVDARRDLDLLGVDGLKDPRASYLMAMVEAESGQSKEAQTHLRHVAEFIDKLSPEYVNASEQLLMLGAMSHHGAQSLVRAKEYLDAIMRRYPRNIGARKLLASIYLDEGDAARALSTVEPALEALPNDPGTNLLAGRAQLALKRYIQARERLQIAADKAKNKGDALFALGLTQIGLGKTEEAQKTLQEANRIRPGHLGVVQALATLDMQRGEPEKAVVLAQAMAERYPDNPMVTSLLGSVQLAKGDFDDARISFERALQRLPDSVPLALNLARAEIAAKHFDSAKARLDALLARYADDPRVMFERARLDEAEGRLEAAIAGYRKALDKQPGQVEPALALAEVLSRLGKRTEALGVAKEIGLRHPEDMAVQTVLAQAFLAAGDAGAARRTYKNMTRIADFDADAQVRIGRFMLQAGFPEDALYNAQKAVTAQTDFAPAYALMIDATVSLGKIDDARAALENLRRLAPASPRLPVYEGSIALAGKDLQSALKIFSNVHRTRQDGDSALNLAAVYMQMGEAASAKNVLERQLKRDETSALISALAQVHESLGQWDAARKGYQRLAEQSPDDSYLLRRLALVQLALDDPEATPTINKALTLAPDNPQIIDAAGWIRLKQGRSDEALALLRDARLRAPGNARIRFHLAEALLASGRRGEALAEFQAAVKGGAPGDPEVEQARHRLQALER